MLRRLVSFVLALSAFFLAGCNDNPSPSQNLQNNLRTTKYAVVKAGEPFEVEGCSVQVHRVVTASNSLMPNFTLATAKCPTAQVTATSERCGKTCVSEVVQVEAVKEDSLSSAPSEKLEAAQRLAAFQALASSELVHAQAQAQLAAAKRRVLELDAGSTP